MKNRKIIIAAIWLVTCVLAFALSYLLLKSTSLAMMAYLGILGVAMIFAEPFIGLVNYLLFLYVRPQEYVSGMTGMPIVLMVGVVTLGLMVFRMAVMKRRIEVTRAPQNLLIVWFFLAIVASHFAYLYLQGAMNSAMDFVPTMVMYFLITNLVTSHRKLKFTVNLVVVLTLVLAAQGVVQHFTGVGFGGQETYKGRIQAVGIFSDPNDLALALVIVLPFVFLKLVERAKPWEKLLAVLAMGLLVYALYLTASRGGLLSFGVLMIMLLSRKYGKVPGLIAGGVVMLAVFVVGPRMATISTEEASTYGRVEAWGLGLDLFEQFPLFGVGAGNYTEYHFRTAHNSFVLCASELGMFGLFPWVMMIYLSIKNNHFISKHMREARMEDVAIYADTVRYGLIAFILAAYFLSRTYSELLFILIGLSAAITHMFVAESPEKYKLVERKDFVYAFFLVVAVWAFTKSFLFFAW